jgi:colanic acid/amylovoran biosynthesis glycosyltransferase
VRVCYVIGTYPLVTTTFVDREIDGLRDLGVDVQILAVRRPPADARLSTDQRRLQRNVRYLLPVSAARLVLGHARFARRRPGSYFATLARLVSRPHPNWRARGKTVLHFGEGVYAAAIARDLDCDEFHAHFADRAATIALVAARLLDRQYSLSVHAGADIYVEPVLLPEKLSAARHVLTCTARNKERLTAALGDDVGTKITVVPHGVDLRAFRPVSSPPPTSSPVILAVGQCKERKGFAQLIEACHRLRDEGVDLTCRIIGDGPARVALLAKVRALGLDTVVQLPGALSNDDVWHEYQRAAVFALPCIEASDGDVDGIPNVLIEAMACALPVVSSDLPAIRELVVSGENGALVPPGDSAALAAALRELLDDPSRRAALGNNGRVTVVEMFDARVNTRRFADVLWPGRRDDRAEVRHAP